MRIGGSGGRPSREGCSRQFGNDGSNPARVRRVVECLQLKVDIVASSVILPESPDASTVRRLAKKESKVKIIADKGKIKIGGAAINLIKPAVTDKGKIQIGGAAISLIKPTRK
jgi:hypothetical protein